MICTGTTGLRSLFHFLWKYHSEKKTFYEHLTIACQNQTVINLIHYYYMTKLAKLFEVVNSLKKFKWKSFQFEYFLNNIVLSNTYNLNFLCVSHGTLIRLQTMFPDIVCKYPIFEICFDMNF